MSMKKIVGLVIALVIIGGLGYFAYTLSNENGTNDSELISFAIDDIESIDRIIINDPQSQKFEIVRKGKEWTEKSGACVQQEGVAFILDAIKKIEFKGYLPENGQENMLKNMIAKHTKVEIFQNGEWSKTWFLGPAAQDHLGQIMLLESEEFGKSDLPVLIKISNLITAILVIFGAVIGLVAWITK